MIINDFPRDVYWQLVKPRISPVVWPIYRHILDSFGAKSSVALMLIMDFLSEIDFKRCAPCGPSHVVYFDNRRERARSTQGPYGDGFSSRSALPFCTE